MEDKKCGGALCGLSLTLLLIGGVTWGLVGLGTLIGKNINVINLVLGKWPKVEAIVYLLVGLMALKVLVMMLMGRKCCGSNCSCEKCDK